MRKRITIVVLSIFLYLFLMNNLPSFKNSPSSIEELKTDTSPIVSFGVSDSLSIYTRKVRWYGIWIESETDKYLKLFKLVKIPFKKHGLTLWTIHLGFLFLIALFLLQGGTNEKYSTNSLNSYR